MLMLKRIFGLKSKNNNYIKLKEKLNFAMSQSVSRKTNNKMIE